MERRIGILAYRDVDAVDLVGPHEVFATANRCAPAGADHYALSLLSLDGCAVRTESGLELAAEPAAGGRPPYDTIIVPGGGGVRKTAVCAAAAAWLTEHAAAARRVASVCTGIYALARTGLLDGRHVTTHWRYSADVARQFPALRVEQDAIFIRDGKFYTSAGSTAGIDLCLALVEEDLGPKVSLAVARQLVVYLKRPGGQLQYSEPLRFQVSASDRLADLAAWIPAHLGEDLPVDRLAEQAGMSRRHLARVFRDVFEASPADFVEALRLDEACRRLPMHGQTVGSIAASLGFQSADAFRRAFERRLGVSPTDYRQRFQPAGFAELTPAPAPTGAGR